MCASSISEFFELIFAGDSQLLELLIFLLQLLVTHKFISVINRWSNLNAETVKLQMIWSLYTAIGYLM